MKRTLKILAGILLAGILGFIIWAIKYGDKDSAQNKRGEPMVVYTKKEPGATNAVPPAK